MRIRWGKCLWKCFGNFYMLCRLSFRSDGGGDSNKSSAVWSLKTCLRICAAIGYLSGPSNSMSLKWHLSACPLPHLQNPQLSERPHPRDLLIRWGRKEMEGGWCSGSGKPAARSCCQPSLILSRVCPCSGPHPSISWRMASGSRARGQET